MMILRYIIFFSIFRDISLVNPYKPIFYTIANQPATLQSLVMLLAISLRAEHALSFSPLLRNPRFDSDFFHPLRVFNSPLMMRHAIRTELGHTCAGEIFTLKTVSKPSLFGAEHHFAVGAPVSVQWTSAPLTPYLLWFNRFVAFFLKPLYYFVP